MLLKQNNIHENSKEQFKKDFFVHLVLQNMIEIQKKNIQAIKNSYLK
jgi:hypothetical protein